MAEPREYNPALLTSLDVTSLDFARTWVRTLLRDRPEVETGGVPIGPGQPARPRVGTWPEFSRSDTEINAALKLDAVISTVASPVIYYRPHFTAARLYLGDPSLWRSRAVDGSSESRRDSREIISAWLAQGAALDAQIPVMPLPPFETATSSSTGSTTAVALPRTVVIQAEGGW